MNNYKFSKRSLNNLNSVKPELQKVIGEAMRITTFDFAVISGLRSIREQKKLVKGGFSKTMNSRHLTGHAVDLAPYPIDWNDLERFDRLAVIVKQAAINVGVEIEWGGDWTSFVDRPHYQLPRNPTAFATAAPPLPEPAAPPAPPLPSPAVENKAKSRGVFDWFLDWS